MIVDEKCVLTFDPDCYLECPDGYSASAKCSRCISANICLIDNPCQNGGTCILLSSSAEYE